MENKPRGTDGKFTATEPKEDTGLVSATPSKGANTPNLKPSEKVKQNQRYLREKDRETVKGVFNYYERKGGTLKFSFRKYKGDPIESYELDDGKVYTIPRGVAKHLNTSGAYKTHDYATDENGKQVQKITTPVRRYGFQSLEFTTFDEMESDKIVTVENV